MLSKQAIEEQLTRIGCNFRMWGRSEINELDKILMEDEIIAQCVNGEYENGFAMLLATNHRVLLVDKKPFLYLTVEDLRFDMITDFNYNHRLVNATIRISTPNKVLTFMSWNKKGLRKLIESVQQRVLEMRKHNQMAQYFNTYAAMQQTPRLQQFIEAQPMRPSQYQESTYVPNAAPQPTVDNASATVTEAVNRASYMASRLAAKRSVLGTYTRSKLPKFRHHGEQDQPVAEAGEVYPQGYRPGVMSEYQNAYEH